MGVVAHSCNLIISATPEADTGGPPVVQGQPGCMLAAHACNTSYLGG